MNGNKVGLPLIRLSLVAPWIGPNVFNSPSYEDFFLFFSFLKECNLLYNSLMSVCKQFAFKIEWSCIWLICHQTRPNYITTVHANSIHQCDMIHSQVRTRSWVAKNDRAPVQVRELISYLSGTLLGSLNFLNWRVWPFQIHFAIAAD